MGKKNKEGRDRKWSERMEKRRGQKSHGKIGEREVKRDRGG